MIRNKETMIEFLKTNSVCLFNIYSRMKNKSEIYSKEDDLFFEKDSSIISVNRAFDLLEVIENLSNNSENKNNFLIIYNFCLLFLAKQKLNDEFVLSLDENKIVEKIIENMKYAFVSQEEYETCFLKKINEEYPNINKNDLNLNKAKELLLTDIKNIKEDFYSHYRNYFLPNFKTKEKNKTQLIFEIKS